MSQSHVPPSLNPKKRSASHDLSKQERCKKRHKPIMLKLNRKKYRTPTWKIDWKTDDVQCENIDYHLLPRPFHVSYAHKEDQIRKWLDDKKGKDEKKQEQSQINIQGPNFRLKHLPPQFKLLQEKGYQVIPGIIDSKLCQQTVKSIHQWFQDIGSNHIKGVPGAHRQVSWGISWADFILNIRTHPHVIDVFSKIWNVPPEHLLASYEVISYMPTECKRPGVKRDQWLHFNNGGIKEPSMEKKNQIVSKFGEHNVRGFVTLVPMKGTFTVFEGSHKEELQLNFFHQFKRCLTAKHHTVLLNAEEKKWLLAQPGISLVSVDAPAGSLILWFSNMAQCTYPGDQIANIYTCFEPFGHYPLVNGKFSNNTLSLIKKKWKAMIYLRSTSFSPTNILLEEEQPSGSGPRKVWGLPNIPENKTRIKEKEKEYRNQTINNVNQIIQFISEQDITDSVHNPDNEETFEWATQELQGLGQIIDVPGRLYLPGPPKTSIKNALTRQVLGVNFFQWVKQQYPKKFDDMEIPSWIL